VLPAQLIEGSGYVSTCLRHQHASNATMAA
jgi:hypothetical protein